MATETSKSPGLDRVRGSDLPYEITHLMSNTQAQSIITRASTDGRDIWLRDGEHAERNLTLPNSGRIRIFGAGAGNTVLTPNSAGDDVISLTAGQTTHSMHLSDFSITGDQVGTGAGINVPSTTTLFSSLIENVYISGMGDAGIRDWGTTFTSSLRNIRVDDCLGHLFDVEGGNTYLYEQCYAMDVPTAGKAGFRHRRGSPVMTSCNGVNSGDYWGIFGRLTSIDGGTTTYCYPSLLNCNIEDFAVAGVVNRTSNFNLTNCTFVAPATGTVTAISYDQQPSQSGSLRDTGFTTKGAAWTNSYPIHCRNRVPFVLVVDSNGASAADYYTYYDDQLSLAMTMSSWRSEYAAYTRHTARTRDLKVAERLYLGTGNAYLWGLSLNISADKGNAAATLTVGTSEGTSIWATPLTADRAVTLSTTNAANGSELRIIRSAAATGAFNLNVGTGPLKALAVGQWCKVVYDGSAWVLVEFGSL